MGYVDKKVALQYLANSENLFAKVKTNFVNSYKNGVKEIKRLVKENNKEELHRYIHSIKGISLNVGSNVLYEDAIAVLEKLQREEIDTNLVERFCQTLESVVFELQNM